MRHRISPRYPIVALMVNLLTVYVLFSLSRLVFLLYNWGQYASTMTCLHGLIAHAFQPARALSQRVPQG